MQTFKYSRFVGFLTGLAVLTSCGGGSSGSAPNAAAGPETVTVTAPEDVRVQSVLNQGLSGKLFMTSPDAYIEFDLPTGISRVLRPKDGAMTASLDGKEFALVNSRPADRPLGDTLEELVFFNREGRQTGRILREESFGGRPLISPDKQMVLVEWHSIDLGDEGGIAVPTVFTRDGTIVKRFVDYGNGGGYTWLPNGQILLTRGDTIFVTSLEAQAPTVLKRFPNQKVFSLTTSPDGQRLAFSLDGGADSFDFHTFVMNIDGSNLRQVSNSTLGDAPGDFSPDGNFLLVADGSNFFTSGPGFFVAGCAELYVVPLNIASVIQLDRDVATPNALKLRSRFEDTGDISLKVCGFTKPYWRNVSVPDFVPGTPIAGTGLNRGLAGLTYYGFAGDLYRSNLFTGETVNLAKTSSNTPHVSRDGSQILYYDTFLNPATSRLDAVLFLNNTGVQQARINVREGFSGALKLSPDNRSIASEWHNLDLGDAGGVSVVTVFASDFSGILQRYEGFTSFEWMPDGRLLLGVDDELWIASASLDTLTRIASFGDRIGRLALSRDGQKLAFNMYGNIWTSSLSGTGTNLNVSAPVRLSDSSRLVGKPEFSPDGKTILVHSADDISSQVWVMPVDGQRVPIMHQSIVNTSAFALKSIENGSERRLSPGTAIGWR